MAAFTHLVSSSRWRSATAPRPGSPPQRSGHLLCHSAPASNKPHPAEKRTPVWLAIWRIWAGFANSQLRLATLRCIYIYIYMRPSPLLPPWSCCSDRRKSLGPSAPIAYATSVSPPDEAVAWPGCGVPANHLPRWVPPHALLARDSVDGATNLCSPSTVPKVNFLVIRCLYFGSVRGDLHEDNFYASRCPVIFFQHSFASPEHKIGIFVRLRTHRQPGAGIWL